MPPKSTVPMRSSGSSPLTLRSLPGTARHTPTVFHVCEPRRLRCFPDVEVLQRRRLTVRGAVQGVGFRPFVHALASQLALEGSVRNTTAGVVVDVQGPAATLDEFAARMVSEPPA